MEKTALFKKSNQNSLISFVKYGGGITDPRQTYTRHDKQYSKKNIRQDKFQDIIYI